MRAWVGSALGGLLFVGAARVWAAPPEDLESVSSPRVAYDRATKAWKADEKEAAAHWFARADLLQPSERALGSALRAASSAKLAPLAMALAARADRAPANAELAKLSKEARAAFSESTGRVDVDCAAATPCTPALDGLPLPEAGYTTLGVHEVTWACADGKKSKQVNVEAKSPAKVTATCASEPTLAEAPAPPPPLPPAAKAKQPAVDARPAGETTAERHGMSPTWFWVGVGATAVLGGLSVWSGLDTKSQHDEYVEGGRLDGTKRSSGESAQTRTNLLLAGTGVAGLVTLGIGVFAVDFRRQSLQASITPDPTGPKLGLGGHF